MNIFELRPLIANFNCKLSAISSKVANRQLLCLVNQENEILILRYSIAGHTLKLISYFKKRDMEIQDICFDPSGRFLIVICFDNTLSIVPCAVVEKEKSLPTENKIQSSFSTTHVTSYIIPFVGPHECPDSKNCPNGIKKNIYMSQSKPETDKEVSFDSMNKLQSNQQEEFLSGTDFHDMNNCLDTPIDMFAEHLPFRDGYTSKVNNQKTSQIAASSSSNNCPYPLSVAWWQTIDGHNRAIIGYSDGSICFVGLSPNCPFIASTEIETGSVVKLLICKDNTFESVMLLITSSLKIQYKLLLEQKAIKFLYPGDISPTTTHAQNSDWQIVMPLNQTEDDLNVNIDKSMRVDDKLWTQDTTLSSQVDTNSNQQSALQSYVKAPISHSGQLFNVASNNSVHMLPPPFSLAVNNQTDTESVDRPTLSSDQQHDNLRGGILPAARARLSSLRSLGSKKLTAIKMRLYDTRQKIEEYVPENAANTFAIMDSPSLTPEKLSNDSGSYFALQNLRSTYLISALHSQSNTLTVHTIDASLRPLFFYKVPQNCHDILISSNILYTIQYIETKRQVCRNQTESNGIKTSVESNTEKENRDTDIEKENYYGQNNTVKEKVEYAESNKDADVCESHNNESVEQSATATNPSSNACAPPRSMVNAVGVISSAMASCAGHEMDNKPEALLALFGFENETVLSLYQMATNQTETSEPMSKNDRAKAFAYKDIRSPLDYVQFYMTVKDEDEKFSLRQMEIMQYEFPRVNYDPCYVITDKNVFFINIKKEPFSIFLDAALASDWKQCREFCNIFDFSFETCIEFAGDYLLRRNKIAQALLTYNSARVKPIRTALKLAMYGHTSALMQLCAMALKVTFILKSKNFCSPILRTILENITYRHSEDVRTILPKTARDRIKEGVINEGAACSDFMYGVDETVSNLSMSPSSQFHLANLLLITLAEKAVKDKNYLPLWNFLVINSKYHTNMTSIVLCQSGLFSSAVLLAKVRGVWIDAFVALISVVAQEFAWYAEFNVCLYNVSDPVFAQILTYVPHVAIDYFGFIQEKIERIRDCVLQRLEKQLNPFSATLRPIVSHMTTDRKMCNSNENNAMISDLCNALIETYLAVIIQMVSLQSTRGRITNSLSTFRITYEDDQFAIESSRFKPISAGCAHCACVLDGVAYFWGSNGVSCVYNANKTSDPPEPPHAVKSLDLLSQLNLEVHAVKCGRQHTLILTNNGLYAFGNNYQSQLGVGNQTQVALQPILLEALDGKNITILEAGQYHNAAVADGLLYTWGWGIYGQLGHGDAENVSIPKIVEFFKLKKILQVSLGHAHSLILCQGENVDQTHLFVFGSNHFGQLGIGADIGTEFCTSSGNDVILSANKVKSALPIKLEVCSSRLRLIHTKFFANIAVDENEKMYTWGSSPQALRLANQIKRRANAKQKLEEHQRREVSKKFEATLSSSETFQSEDKVCSLPSSLLGTEQKDTNNEELTSDTNLSFSSSENDRFSEANIEKIERNVDKIDTDDPKVSDITVNATEQTVETIVLNSDDKDKPGVAVRLCIDAVGDVTEEIVQSVQPMISKPLQNVVQELASNKFNGFEAKQKETDDSKSLTTEEYKDPEEHMFPHLVDTSEISGRILQISSGLFHYALISSTGVLYTWGKNLEHQLGTEDKERRAVNKPLPLDNIESPMYVDCGADFTVVMTSNYAVKAFGGNSNGQCGRDLGPSLDKMKQRIVCLPTTKRLMRFESQCVEAPVEINLPRPSIRHNNVRFLKMIPKFQTHFLQEAEINFSDNINPPEQNRKNFHRNFVTSDQDSDDVISSLENLSNNDFNVNDAAASTTFGLDSFSASNCNSSLELTPEEQSFSHFVQTTENQIRPLQQDNFREKLSLSAANDNQSLTSTMTSATEGINAMDAYSEEHQQKLRKMVHYCLFIFHGLYNPDRVFGFAKSCLEYRIRIHMLHFKFVDAFVLCLEDCDTTQKALKIFEYYSKDTSFVPMRRQDLKFLIYYLMRHFLERKLDLLICEHFFLADLEFYILELAYVLYFNNNNTILERNLSEKFKNVIPEEENNMDSPHKLEDAVIHLIFDSLSIKFKTKVCQQLLKLCPSK